MRLFTNISQKDHGAIIIVLHERIQYCSYKGFDVTRVFAVVSNEYPMTTEESVIRLGQCWVRML